MKIIALILTMLMFGITTKAQLAVGEKVPEFTLKDQNGNAFKSTSVIGKEITIIYFYPKDDTPGCTKEACSFRDSYEGFSAAGVTVIGISADDVASHKKFAQKYNLPFTLLADSENKVRQAFGVKADLFGLLPGRVTFVIDKNGKVSHVFSSQMNAEMHVKESLAAVKKLKG